VAALTGQPEHLLAATRDWLHQDQREPAMPETLALVRRLRADGVPAVVSGAGPTVLAFGSADTSSLVARCPDGWACHDLTVDAGGATLLT
jgi:homoserine kinase